MSRRQWIIFAVVIGLIGGTAGVLARLARMQRLGPPGLKLVKQPLFDPDGKQVADHRLFFPAHVLDYTSKLVPVTHLELDWLPKDTTFGRRVYRSAQDGFEVLASSVLMGTDRTSIHKPQYCLPGQGFTIERSERTHIRIDRPRPYDLPVMKLLATKEVDRGNGQKWVERAVFVYWFVSDDEITASHWKRMWWMARDILRTGELKRWGYVTYLAVCAPGREAATFERIKKLIAASVPQFQLVVGTSPP